jgi:ABC-2 type transport system permease protein
MKICLLFREEIKYLLGGKVPPAVILITLPVIFTALFGIIYEENVVNHIPLAIYDQDQTSLSRKLVQMYEDAERFRAVSYVSDDEEMEKEIRTGNVKAALIIPADFSKNIQSGQGTNILLTVNSANNMFGNAALSAAQEINRSFTVAISEKLLEGTGLLPAEAVSTAYSIRLGVRILGNPANGYSPFMLSGLLLNGLQIGIMIVLSPYLYDELQRRKKDMA